VARGRNAKVGATRISNNGYHYTKCEEGWRLTHHIIAEKLLGRKLQPGERVTFEDNDRTNFKPANIKVARTGGSSLERRLAALDDRIRELQAQREELADEIARAKTLQAQS
jgi:hypothetical protein